MYSFQTYVVIPITAYIMWDGLVFLCHWRLTSGKLVFLFLAVISNGALAKDDVYRPIETYMRNSTSLTCNEDNFRSILEAAVKCHMKDGCRAAITWAEMGGDGHFGVCKCVTNATQRTLISDKPVMYLRVNGVFSTGEKFL